MKKGKCLEKRRACAKSEAKVIKSLKHRVGGAEEQKGF